MKQKVICINSDSLNRNGYLFPLSTLEDSLQGSYNKGMTMCIGHDMHRPIGWLRPFALYMEPKLVRMLGLQLIGESDADYKQLQNAHNVHIQNRYYEAFNKVKEPFLELIGQHISDSHVRLEAGCAAVYDVGIAPKFFSSLFDKKDDDGLIALSTLLADFKYLGQGIFKDRHSDLALYAHKFFRRSQSIHNNFHFSFLDELIKHTGNQDVTVKICLDEDMLGYAPSFHNVMEQEYHWGPKYTDEIDKIKFGISRHETNDFQREYYGITRSEFLWKHDDEEMTFEMEELKDVPTPFSQSKGETYHCRYVHSIYNTTSKEFIHFDGAIRTYPLDDMIERLDKTFLEYGRKAEYKKLFRIDGKLQLSNWKLLVTHYLQGNPLVYEYFGEGDNYGNLLEELNAPPMSLEQELIPYAIKPELGLRLCISYHAIQSDLKQGRYIDIYDQMSLGDETIYCAEHLVYEVKHALGLLGEDLEINPDILLVKCADRYWNIPSIMHNTTDIADSIAKTKSALINLLTAIEGKGGDSDISFSWAFPMDERLVRISSYGNISQQLKWLKSQTTFSITSAGFQKWLSEQQVYLSKFEVNTEIPSMGIIQTDGVLFLKRRPVHVDYEYNPTDQGLKFTLSFPKEADELYEMYNNNVITAVPLIAIKQAIWSDTKESYFSSGRSLLLKADASAQVIISEWEPYHLYWSKT